MLQRLRNAKWALNVKLRVAKKRWLDWRLDQFAWMLRHPPPIATPALATAPGQFDDDADLVDRIRRAYRQSLDTFIPSAGSWDTNLDAKKRDVHEALCGAEAAAAAKALRDPATNFHFWGFDSLARTDGEMEPHRRVLYTVNARLGADLMLPLWIYDGVVSLAEAVGARPVFYPEAGLTANDDRALPQSVDDILDSVAAAVGVDVEFPNPYAGEVGLASRRGIVSFRAVQALYQAWRIARLAEGQPGYRVLEVGAGLGRTAYFAHRLGVTDYTIVDIPITTAAQGYFLGRTLGAHRVRLPGEAAGPPLRIVSSGEIDSLDGSFDLLFNADSWSELSLDIARRYWAFARERSRGVLSINHEFNPFTVRSLNGSDEDVQLLRYPYWMRPGYVEEYLTWKP